jgi:hypothetical protein
MGKEQRLGNLSTFLPIRKIGGDEMIQGNPLHPFKGNQ